MDLLSADLCATGWHCTCPERVQPQSRRPGTLAPTALPAGPARAVQAAVRLPPGRCRRARWPSDPRASGRLGLARSPRTKGLLTFLIRFRAILSPLLGTRLLPVQGGQRLPAAGSAAAQRR